MDEGTETELKTKGLKIDFMEEAEESLPVTTSKKSLRASASNVRLLRFGSTLHTWTDLSRINYVSALTFSTDRRGKCWESSYYKKSTPGMHQQVKTKTR